MPTNSTKFVQALTAALEAAGYSAAYELQAGGIVVVLVNFKEKTECNAMHNLAIISTGAQVASSEGDATANIECKLLFEAGAVTARRVAFPLQPESVSIPVNVLISVYITAKDQKGDFVVCLAVQFIYIYISSRLALPILCSRRL